MSVFDEEIIRAVQSMLEDDPPESLEEQAARIMAHNDILDDMTWVPIRD